jgi:hypothetical protein
MARQTNAVITFSDAWDMIEQEGYVLKSSFSRGNKTMTKSEIEAYLHVNNSNFSTYAENRLVPYDLIQKRGTGWRVLDGYCETTDPVTYYAYTTHRSGSQSSSYGTQITAVAGYSGDYKISRRRANGTTKDAGVTYSGSHHYPTYDAGDVIVSSVPYNQIDTIKMQYNLIDKIYASFNQFTQMTLLNLRRNYMDLGNMDLTQCYKLKYLNITGNIISTLTLPTDYTNNYFEYAGTGDYSNIAYLTPRQVINEIMRYAYNSKVTGTATSLFKNLATDADTGTIDYDGVNYHKLLLDKGWTVNHVSTEEEIFFNSSSGTYNTTIMSSAYDWNTSSADSWITVNSSGSKSNNEQTVSFTLSTNSTGSTRSGIIKVHKIKPDLNEYQHPATIKITQHP